MDYTDVTCTEILDLVKEQWTAILNLKTNSTHINEHRTKVVINELQADLQEMLATLKSATIKTTDTAYNPASCKLIMWQQSLCNAKYHKIWTKQWRQLLHYGFEESIYDPNQTKTHQLPTNEGYHQNCQTTT